ncbi:MAG: non-canonical purine NTP pyrophosphatase, RdgB/HAM1 family [Flavobacteriales bacterium]|nr:non-canonical purine NTP pyrophosphatase, RdgB/HAM1 family [Flavobacteriales bacterium]
MNKYIFASSNNHKILELSHRVPHLDICSLADIGYHEEIIESGFTLEENARIKAKTIYDKYKIASISDDTGLEVDYLQGQPGVFSARYAGQPSDPKNNIIKLLKEMEGVKNRRAVFRTVICLINNDKEIFFEGVVQGTITDQIYGHNGFGYDPIFIPVGFERTFAQISLAEKNQISHRAKAIQKLVDYLQI